MKKVTVSVLALALIIGFASVATADDDEDSDVDVEVTSVTELDVKPDQLDYQGEPGDLDEESDRGFSSVELENVGSEAIELVHASSDMHDSNPFGTGTESEYNAGNMVMLSTEPSSDVEGVADGSSATTFNYANRVEFDEDPAPSYIQTLEDELDEDPDAYDELANYDSSDFTDEAVDVGRFREGDENYFYAIFYDEDDGSSACAGGGSAEIWVGTTEHTPDAIGTFDFTDSGASDIEVYDLVDADATDIGVAESAIDYNDVSYEVFTHCTADDGNVGHTIRTNFNVEVTSPVLDQTVDENNDGGQEYIFNSGSDPFEPGEFFNVDVGVQIPLGTAQGNLETGTLTITAQENQ